MTTVGGMPVTAADHLVERTPEGSFARLDRVLERMVDKEAGRRRR